uniref:Uncharacterized protein n=1 Tax=Panstrongylus lignarius TaxID=156445 RepID=A0A224XNG3_9HEMI
MARAVRLVGWGLPLPYLSCALSLRCDRSLRRRPRKCLRSLLPVRRVPVAPLLTRVEPTDLLRGRRLGLGSRCGPLLVPRSRVPPLYPCVTFFLYPCVTFFLYPCVTFFLYPCVVFFLFLLPVDHQSVSGKVDGNFIFPHHI